MKDKAFCAALAVLCLTGVLFACSKEKEPDDLAARTAELYYGYLLSGDRNPLNIAVFSNSMSICNNYINHIITPKCFRYQIISSELLVIIITELSKVSRPSTS